MASPEADRTVTEKIGRGVLITGLALLTYAIIGSFDGLQLPGANEETGLLGGGLAVSGIIFERVGKKKK